MLIQYNVSIILVTGFVLLKGTGYNMFSPIIWSHNMDPVQCVVARFQSINPFRVSGKYHLPLHFAIIMR